MRWSDNDLGFLVGCTHRAMRGQLVDQLAGLGLSFETYQLLVALEAGDDIAQTTLADRLCLEKTYITRMLQAAEDQRLVKRERDAEDNRVVRARLTDAGRARLRQAAAVRQSYTDRLLACLSTEEEHELRRLLVKVRDHALQGMPLL